MSSRYRTALVTAALGGALLAPALATAPAATGAAAPILVRSTVTIAGYQVDEFPDVRFFGRVTARRNVCEARRLVTLRQVEQGVVAGRDRTNARGRWAVTFDGTEIDGGTFKAIVARKVIRRPAGRIVCQSDTATFDVTSEPPPTVPVP